MASTRPVQRPSVDQAATAADVVSLQGPVAPLVLTQREKK